MLRRHSFWMVAAAIFFILILFTFAAYSMNAHALSLDSISKIQNGDSKWDVKNSLGNPSQIHDLDSGETWVYAGYTWCQVTIDFDEDEKVCNLAHDH